MDQLSNTPTATAALHAFNEALEMLRAVNLQTTPNALLAPLAKALKDAGAAVETLDCEIIRRHGNGELVPGAAVKDATTQRKWHDEETAAQLAYAQFGLKAFKLIGPAAVEKLNDEGKALAAVASYKPPADSKKVVY